MFSLFGICVLVVRVLPSAPPTSSQPTSLAATSQPTSLPAASELPPDKLFALAAPAVVKLIVKDEDDREIGAGSGFIVAIEKEKYDIAGQPVYTSTVITNCHVIHPAVSLDVLFNDGKSGWISKVLTEDESVDVAVLEATSLDEPIRALRFHDGTNPAVGTKVYAIGSPRGLRNTLSEGLISGYRNRGKHEAWIQITAPISPGSSGGPLFSAEGAVLAVTTTSLRDSQNLNFAVPAGEISRLLKGAKKSRGVSEGASVREAVRNAFKLALIRHVREYMEQHPDDKNAEEIEDWRVSRMREGDQLSLLLEGHKLCGNENYDEAIRTLKLAVDAEREDYAYLACYELAVARAPDSDRVFCTAWTAVAHGNGFPSQWVRERILAPALLPLDQGRGLFV